MTDLQPSSDALPQSLSVLIIGNSRLHWAYFWGEHLRATWHTPHLDLPKHPSAESWSDWVARSPALAYHQTVTPEPFPEVWMASVVPAQATLWQHYPRITEIKLADVPLQATYPTLGVDRALAVWAGGTFYHWPILAIDAGTALTLTGADTQHQLVGGAILPGLGRQMQLLSQTTAALSALPEFPAQLPSRWAQDTTNAIYSGIIYTVLAGLREFIEHWYDHFPHSALVLTGGDSPLLHHYLQQQGQTPTQPPVWLNRCVQDSDLLFQGLRCLRSKT